MESSPESSTGSESTVIKKKRRVPDKRTVKPKQKQRREEHIQYLESRVQSLQVRVRDLGLFETKALVLEEKLNESQAQVLRMHQERGRMIQSIDRLRHENLSLSAQLRLATHGNHPPMFGVKGGAGELTHLRPPLHTTPPKSEPEKDYPSIAVPMPCPIPANNASPLSQITPQYLHRYPGMPHTASWSDFGFRQPLRPMSRSDLRPPSHSQPLQSQPMNHENPL